MDNVPNELLALIFEFVYERPLGDLTKCLRVCSRWRDFAIPILYQNLVLHDKRLQCFLSKFTTATKSCAQSATIGIIHKLASGLSFPYGRLQREEVLQALKEVPLALHGVQSLTTSSIRLFCGTSRRDSRFPGRYSSA
jgi:hypothetical protein